MQGELWVLAYIYGSHALRRPEGLTAGWSAFDSARLLIEDCIGSDAGLGMSAASEASSDFKRGPETQRGCRDLSSLRTAC